VKVSFVGRTRELSLLAHELEAGHNIVLTGAFGSGRTTLVKALSAHVANPFLFWHEQDTRRTMRAAIAREHDAHGATGEPPVVVLDDAVHVSAPRRRFMRELLRGARCQIIVVVERSMSSDQLAHLRAILGAARLVQLRPLSTSTTVRYFSSAVKELGLAWSADDIRETARSTHGHPLTMRMTLEAAVAKSLGRRRGDGTPPWRTSSSEEETRERRWSPPSTVWPIARLMTPAESSSAGICLEVAMTTLCPACWRVVPNDAHRCNHCGAALSSLHQRDLRDKLLGALTHPDRDTVIRAAVALAARHDPDASHAIETAMARFPHEPHVLGGLLTALMFVGDEEARRIAQDALGHRSFIVRRAAAQMLQQMNRCQEAAGDRREH
jgi:hypothetical protein